MLKTPADIYLVTDIILLSFLCVAWFGRGLSVWFIYGDSSRISATIMLGQLARSIALTSCSCESIPVQIKEEHDQMETKLDERFLVLSVFASKKAALVSNIRAISVVSSSQNSSYLPF